MIVVSKAFSFLKKYFKETEWPSLSAWVFFYCLGIITAQYLKISFGILVVVAVGLLGVSAAARKRPRASTILVLCLAVAIGAFAWTQSHTLASSAIARCAPYRSHAVELRGVVASDPQSHHKRIYFTLDADQLTYRGRPYRVSGKVRVRCKGCDELRYGDDIVVRGGLFKPPKFFNTDDPILSVRDPEDVTRMGRNKGSVAMSLIFSLKERLKDILSAHLEPLYASLFKALILGDKYEVPHSIKDVMVKTGTWHMMVVSGSHTALLAFVFLILLKIFRMPRRARYLSAMLLLAVYCLLTGASSPVLRSTVMAAAFLVSYLVERNPLFYNTLALAGLVILFFDPAQLLDVGFQLSFLSVFFIVWLSPQISALLPRRFFQQRLLAWVINCFCVSLAAWLGTAPLIAYTFGNFSPITVFANMATLPLASLVMMGGFALIAFGGVMPLSGSYLGPANELLLALLLKINIGLSKLPFAFWVIVRPPMIFIFVYYFILFLAAGWAGRVRKARLEEERVIEVSLHSKA